MSWSIASAQMPADPEAVARLQERWENLGPRERLEAIRALQATPDDSLDATGDLVVPDDRGSPPPDLDMSAPATSASAAPPRFGETLFGQPPDTFQPVKLGPVPDDYRLAPGDEMVVEVWGDVSFREREAVDRDGGIVVREAGRIVVANRTLAQARAEITRRLAEVISGVRVEGGGTTFVEVSLARLRTIRVFVVGEARRPGGYEVSAAATVFQALYAAAGPSGLGSLRDVRLLREGKVRARVDLYEYLLEGTRSSDVTLQDGDTVFIPVAERTVTLTGAVRRPLRFELREGEGLRDALRMAGGLMASARSDLAHVQRIVPFLERQEGKPVRIELDVPLDGYFDAGRPVVPLEDGDVVYVLAVNDRAERFVSVAGSVASPGRYAYAPDMRVSDLLAKAGGLWRDAFLERAVVVRVGDDYSRHSVSLGLAHLAAGSADDLVLAPMDSLHVFGHEKMQDVRQVSLFGAVREPGLYRFQPGMTAQDLVLAGRGLTEDADLTGAELSRLRVEADGDTVAVLIPTPLGENASAASGVRLENHDNLFVRQLPGWHLPRNVTVLGEVRRPGVYTLLSRQERLSDLLARAGGVLESGYAAGFHFERADIGIVGVDLDDALAHPGGRHDILLQDGDVLRVPPMPSSVTVTGEVGHPTSVVYRQGKGIGYYVSRAGGYSQGADKGRARVVLPNGIARPVKRFWPDPEVKPGSTIEVPAKQHTGGIDWGTVIVRTSQIAAAVATIFIATN